VLLSFVASAFMIVALGARPAQGWEWTILHIGGFELAFMLAAYAVGLLARWIYLRIR
jgi:hypothetical protein